MVPIDNIFRLSHRQETANDRGLKSDSELSEAELSSNIFDC